MRRHLTALHQKARFAFTTGGTTTRLGTTKSKGHPKNKS